MTSSIDPTVPVAGNPTTESVRANFAAAKLEIENLQERAAELEESGLLLIWSDPVGQNTVLLSDTAAGDVSGCYAIRADGFMYGPLLYVQGKHGTLGVRGANISADGHWMQPMGRLLIRSSGAEFDAPKRTINLIKGLVIDVPLPITEIYKYR